MSRRGHIELSAEECRRLKADYFLARQGWHDAGRAALAGDASFRRYERLNRDDDGAVFMDAPPPREDVRSFVAVTKFLRMAGLSAPAVYAGDVASGFLLLEDLGDALFSRVIAEDGPLERPLYEAAVDCLAVLHSAAPPDKIAVNGDDYRVPPYDMALYLDEAALFVDWYLPALRGGPLSVVERNEFLGLWRAALAPVADARDVLVLRDYHADNLIWLPERTGAARVGLLDYQDAVVGHPAYDLVSLLEDARRDVPPARADEMIDRYLAARPDLDEEDFRTAYAVLGAQRNTKIIGIFTRLYARDGKSGYLDLIPRVWGLLERDLAHPALGGLKAWFDDAVPEEIRRIAPEPGNLWQLPGHAMILAAGLGTRMRPLTETTPKPLIPVAGRPILDRTLDRLAAAGVDEAVVNIHHLPDVMRKYLAARGNALPEVTISDETGALLDSGGGVNKALTLLGSSSFFVLNCDTVWDNAGADCLVRLAAAWDPERMDALLLLIPTHEAIGFDGKGDFFLDAAGRLSRRGAADTAPYAFIGIQILSHGAFAHAPAGPFSLNLIYDRALEAGRLFGLVHEGHWWHVGTPDALDRTNRDLAKA